MTRATQLSLGAVLLSGALTSLASAVSPLRVDGIITAVFTPYDANGALNLKAVPSMAEYQKKTGVKGVFVGGTTGDSLALSMSERKALAEAWVEPAKANGLLLIVHVGAEALADAVELTAHAEKIGAQAVGCMASVFFKPATVDSLAQWLKQVASAAPSLPLYYYHIPSMTGVQFMMLDLLKAVEKAGVPNFAGVKYTGLYENRAFMDLEQCRRYNGGRYEVFCGREEMTLQALSVGVRGFIGSQFNFAADLYGAIGKAWSDGNVTHARELQAVAQDLIDVWMQVPAAVNGNRLVMASTPVAVGPARLPSLHADAPTVKAMSQRIGVWCQTADRIVGKPLELCKAASTKRAGAGIMV